MSVISYKYYYLILKKIVVRGVLPTYKYYWVSTRTTQVYDISIFIPIILRYLVG